MRSPSPRIERARPLLGTNVSIRVHGLIQADAHRAIDEAFGEIARVLREGRYAVVIVRDAYQDVRYQFVGADLAARAATAGLVPKGDLIWHQAGTRLRPYGYPRVFVPNIAHQHILVLRREANPRQARRRFSR